MSEALLDELGRQRDRLRLLSEAMQAFADATSDVHRLLDAVANRVAVILQCSCALLVLSDDATTLVPTTLFDADAAVLARSRHALEEPLVLARHPIARRVVEERAPFLLASIDLAAMRPPATTPRYFELLEGLGTHSMVIVPMVARGQTLGALVLTRHAGCPVAFDSGDVDLAGDIAEHAALALSNARALASESAARAEAEAAREAARASERSVRRFFDASPVASFVFDNDDHRLLAVNDAALELYGYTREEFLSLTLADLRCPEEAPDLDAALRRIGDKSANGIGKHRKKDGSPLHLESRSHVALLDGRPARFVALRDLGERVRAEAALELLRTTASSEATFRAFVETAPDAVVIVDRDGSIVLVNAQAERLFGYERSELVGRPIELLVPARARLEHDKSRRAYLAAPTRREMGSGLELHCRRKDGTEVPVEISLSPIDTPSGPLVKTAIRDISARRKAENKFRALLESAPDAKVIIDAEGRIAIVNARTEAMFGYPREELVGHPVEMLIPAAARERHVDHRRGFFADPTARPMGKGLALRARRKDGSEFPVEISLSPLETEDGILVSSAIRDVTERDAMEEALRVANTELEAFSYSVAHDLRAPLRAVHSFAQILLDDYAGGARPLDAEGRDCLQEVHQNAARMGALIDGLLSLSRVARGELRPVVVDLGEVCRRVARQLAAAEPEREVAIVVEPGLEARIDPRLAENLLTNLLANAWKFTRETPAARVEVGKSSASPATFFVRDNGVGFDMRYANKLFAAFQRLHASSAFPGTGIGLATVQRIVHRHGGRVWAESQVGAGATFFFSLPS